MRLEQGTYCPLVKKECLGTKCAWFTRVQGVDKNTGKDVDEYQCAIAWMPMLLVENSGQQRQTGASIDSFRNEVVKANQATARLLMQEQNKLIGEK